MVVCLQSSLLDSNTDQVTLSIPSGGSEVEATAEEDPSPFDIVVGQRDRYRKRVQALETVRCPAACMILEL